MQVTASGSLRFTENGQTLVDQAIALSIAESPGSHVIRKTLAAETEAEIEVATIGAKLVYLQSDVTVTVHLDGEVTGHAVRTFLWLGPLVSGIAISASQEAQITLIVAE
jgi:hypothetical protein